VERLSDRMGDQEFERANVSADVCRERDEVRARRIIEEELKAEGLAWEGLASMKKTAERKFAW